jgi:uncharacterized protein (DUF1684 family)
MRNYFLFLFILSLTLSSCEEASNDEKTNTREKKQKSQSVDESIENPEAPKLLKPENNATVFEDKPLLEWTETSGDKLYQVEIHSDESMEAPTWSDYPSENSWRIEEKFMGLDDGETYYWRVKRGMSDWSEVYSFTVELKD